MAPIVGAGCGGGSSSPTSPAQIPTSVEYAGGAVEGDISVLTSKTVQFVAKDADGNLADASEIVTTLTTGSGVAADVSGAAKTLTTAKSAGEYGSCSLNASDPSYIDCTGPAALPATDVNPRVAYSFAYGGAALTTSTGTGNYTGRLGVSQDTINGGQYSFSQVLSSVNCNGPRVASNGNGWLFMTCLQVISPGNGTIRIYWSNTDGLTWSGPEEITGVNNTNIIKALKTTEDVATATAYVAYNGQSDTMYLYTITGDADGNITISPPKFILGAVHDIAVDSNGGAHVLSTDAFYSCPAYPADTYIRNLQYRKVTSDGGFGAGSNVNDCTTKANPGAEPRLAVTPDGSLAYATWRDIGDGGDPDPDITYVKVAEINTTSTAVSWKKTVAATSSVTANSVLAAGQYAATDRNGNMALTWDESASTSSTSMRTFLSVLDGSTDAFASYLVDTMTGILNDNQLLYSGTAMQIDYAGAYHMFYRDNSLLYTMGTVSSGVLTTTSAMNLSSTGTFPYGSLSTDTDWSGKNFIAWQENGIESLISYVAVGTTD